MSFPTVVELALSVQNLTDSSRSSLGGAYSVDLNQSAFDQIFCVLLFVILPDLYSFKQSRVSKTNQQNNSKQSQ